MNAVQQTPASDAAAAWSAASEEALGAWTCACDAWAAYLTRLAAATSPLDVFEAGARLSMESAEICGRVAAARLGGLRAPLLSDA